MEMRAFGTDRLKIGEDGTFHLSSRHPKEGWVARRQADQIRKEFPGTCVRWHDEYFEVIAVDTLPAGFRYSLVSWSDFHTMRRVVDYDEQSEAKREQERKADQLRRVKAGSVSFSAIFTGLLPAEAQEETENELGVSAVRTSLVSAAFWFLVGVMCVVALVTMRMNSAHGIRPVNPVPFIPPFFYGVGLYFLAESMIRMGLILLSNRGVGSLPVVIGWSILAMARGTKPLRTPEPKLKWELDAATLDRDAYVQREPFLALLSPEAQLALADRYGFDWSRKGRASAIVLLLFALFVLVVTVADLVRGEAGTGDYLTLGIMAYLVWEQSARLRRIGAGAPAGSVLGTFVRPFARKLL